MELIFIKFVVAGSCKKANWPVVLTTGQMKHYERKLPFKLRLVVVVDGTTVNIATHQHVIQIDIRCE